MLLLLACVSVERGPAAEREVRGSELVGDADGPEAIPDNGDAPDDPSEAIFDPTRIADVELTLSDADWAELATNPWAKAWYVGTLTWDGEAVHGVEVRAFGAGSMTAGKPSLKLSFDGADGGEFRGVDELKLDNSAQDWGFLNEYVGTTAMRRFGVPAARTGWARVSINGAPVGFYVVLESIDDRFVERWFGHDDGVLYGMNSGYWGQGLNPMTDGLTWFEPQTSVEGDGTDLVALSGIVATGTDEELAAVLDLDAFARESVGRSVIGSLDAFSADGNNYYLYDDHGVWHVLPWDFDVDFGVWYVWEAMAVDPRAPWLSSPWSYNPVTGADYEDPVLKRQLAMGLDVDALVAEMIAGPLDYATVQAEIEAAADLIAADVHADPLGYGSYFDLRRYSLPLWLHTRLTTLAGGEVVDCGTPDGTPLSAMNPTGTVGWGELLVDRTNWGPGITVASEHFCTGVFAHAPSTVTLTVPAGATRLVGLAGLQDWMQQCGDGATFAIEQGGRTLWSNGTLLNHQDAVAFDVAVAPGELRLLTAVNTEYSCDTTVWAEVYAR